MTPADVLRRAASYLEAHGVESPLPAAERLLMHVLGTDRAGLYARREGLSTAQARSFGRALCQRCTGTPIQYLTGEQSFLGLDLEVVPGVFVPRPETEGLAVLVVESLQGLLDPIVVDVGTGTGAIALAVKSARPDARLIATDVSSDAVDLARRNARRLSLDVDVLRGDLLDPLAEDLIGLLDVIASNPPYIEAEDYDALPPEVRTEPVDALVGGTEVHARLVAAARTWLRPGGWLAVEIGAEQGDIVRALFEHSLVDVEVLPDLAGRDRVVRGRRPLAR
jgi:release factor glutamine methyltransferase